MRGGSTYKSPYAQRGKITSKIVKILRRSAEMAGQNIYLWVSAGSFAAPYYLFYADSGGSQELSDLSFDTSRSYTFRRLDEATSHPFYLSDTAYKKNSSPLNGLS